MGEFEDKQISLTFNVKSFLNDQNSTISKTVKNVDFKIQRHVPFPVTWEEW